MDENILLNDGEYVELIKKDWASEYIAIAPLAMKALAHLDHGDVNIAKDLLRTACKRIAKAGIQQFQIRREKCNDPSNKS